jgi:hypothetical protein
MIQTLNFSFRENDFIVIEKDFLCEILLFKPYLHKDKLTLYKNMILRIDFMNKDDDIMITFGLLKKYNKHLELDYVGKFKTDIFNLNGLNYSFLSRDDVETKSVSFNRISKIENLLEK